MSPILLAAVLQIQEPPKKPGKKVAVVLTSENKPVTAREAREAFVRASGLLTKVHGVALGTASIPAAERPATRAEIVTEMARMYKASERTFRFTPAPTTFVAQKFKIDAAQKPALGKLVRIGCIAPVGPLATGPGPGLTPREFGDALGFFMARLGQMSHMPSPKWTPMLQEG